MKSLTNKRGASIMEVVSMAPVIILLAGWAVWFGIETGEWYWCILMAWILASVVAMEIIAVVITGKTISQHFWRWSIKKDADGKKPNVWKAWTMIGMLSVGWVFLMLHLAWKMLTK